MATKAKTKQDTKTSFLDAGIELMWHKGYSNTGLQDILKALDLPKGCFYHYFESKENFALEVIRYFNQKYASEVFAALSNKKLTPIERLREYCEKGRAVALENSCRQGCLIGNLSQEMSDQSEVLRNELCAVMSGWRQQFAGCIEEGQKEGEIDASHEPEKLAEFFLSAWHGALMRAKTVRSAEPIDVFVETMFDEILKPAK